MNLADILDDHLNNYRIRKSDEIVIRRLGRIGEIYSLCHDKRIAEIYNDFVIFPFFCTPQFIKFDVADPNFFEKLEKELKSYKCNNCRIL